MISCNLNGGLGNYMFQIAAAHTLASKNNTIAKFNFSSANQVHKNISCYVDNIFRNVIDGDCELFWHCLMKMDYYYMDIFNQNNIWIGN